MDNRPIVSDLDFQSIKDDMISYFKDRPEFADYEFAGSGLNLLMDILAYNTHYNALAANFALNESFIDTALIRSNVVSLAKSLNYLPRSARSSTTKINLNVPRISNEGFYVIPAGSTFKASGGGQTFNFYTIEDYTVNFTSAATANNITVDIYEGKLSTQRFVHTDTTIEFPGFDLGQTNIDTTTLTVTVNGVKYEQITPENEGVIGQDRNSEIFFIEETRDRTHKIIFGNNVIGKKLNINDVIVATFLRSSGEAANGIKNFSINIPGRSDITTNTVPNISQNGQSPESIQEIKDNAPHWYQSQFRAVTENDYASLLKNKFADIQSINVYGGEKVNQPGKVFIAIKPKSGDALTKSTKDTLLATVLNNSSVVTVRPEFVDPFILKVVLKTVAIYDDARLVTNRSALKAKITSLLGNLNTIYLGEFMDSFRESFLSSQIQELDSAVESSNTRVSLRVDNKVTNGILQYYNWTFNNKLYHPNDGFNAENGGILSTNLFRRAGRTNNSGFDEDGFGNIRLFDVVEGEKITVEPNAGTINYETGDITLEDFDPVDTTINFTTVPDSFDVQANNNIILEIATDDSIVDVLEKNETATIKNLNISRSI